MTARGADGLAGLQPASGDPHLGQAAEAPPGTLGGLGLGLGLGRQPGTAEPAARSLLRRLTRRPWILAWLAFSPVAVLRAGTLSESDTFWQIRVGLVTIGHRAIPAVDTFSWTMRGHPWTLNSWGFDVAAAVAYRIAGLPGAAWLCAALTMALAALVLLLARQLGAAPAVAAVALLVASPFLIGWLTARPQLIDYIALPVLVMLARKFADGSARFRTVLSVGALSVLWVNLHAGALLAVPVTGACAGLLLLRPATRARGWMCLAAAGAALAGCFVNPYGVGIIGQAEQVRSASAGLIVEWQHLNPASPLQDLSLAIGLLGLVIAVRRRDPAVIATLAVTATGAILAIRFLPFVVLIALPVIAAWASHPGPALARYARSRRVMFRRTGVAGFAALALVTAPSLTHIGQPDLARYPVSIAADIPSGCHLFNTDLIGGYIILVRPDVPVSLDTRNTLYGRRRLLADERVLAGRGDLRRGLAGAGCVLIPPRSGLARRLTRDPAWQRRAADSAAVLFVRAGH